MATTDRTAGIEAERRDWDDAAAAWDRWGEWIGEMSRPVTERMLDLARIDAGQRVVDIACGAGDPALPAARRVGRTGEVVAADLSPGMIGVASRRAAEAGLDNLSFVIADVSELDAGDAAFDAALCRFALMLFADPVQATTTMHGLLRPGGRAVAAVWGAPESVPLLSLGGRTIMRELGLAPPPPDAPGLFSLGAPERLAGLIRAGGFDDAAVTAVTTVSTFPSAEAYTSLIREVATVLRRIVEQQPADRQEEVWAAVTEAARAQRDADGTLSLPGEVLIAVATR